MKLSFASAIAFFALCGCGQQAPDGTAASNSPARTDAPAALPSNAYPVPESPTATISDADRPNTIDEFRLEFVRRYKGNIYAPFVDLAYWGDSTNEQKKKYLSYVKAVFTLNSMRSPALIDSPTQIEATPLEQVDQDDRYAYYPREGEESIRLVPEPTHILRVKSYLSEAKPQSELQSGYNDPDTGGLDDEDASADDDERGFLETEFGVGVHDGKYYFCTIQHE